MCCCFQYNNATQPQHGIAARFGDVAQLGERRVRNAKVGSSILLVSTKLNRPLRVAYSICEVEGLIEVPEFDQRAPLAQDADKPEFGGGPEPHAFQDVEIADAMRYSHNLFVSAK